MFFLCSSISQRFVLQVGTENLLLVGREQREERCGEAKLNMGFLLTLPPLLERSPLCQLGCALQQGIPGRCLLGKGNIQKPNGHCWEAVRTKHPGAW